MCAESWSLLSLYSKPVLVGFSIDSPLPDSPLSEAIAIRCESISEKWSTPNKLFNSLDRVSGLHPARRILLCIRFDVFTRPFVPKYMFQSSLLRGSLCFTLGGLSQLKVIATASTQQRSETALKTSFSNFSLSTPAIHLPPNHWCVAESFPKDEQSSVTLLESLVSEWIHFESIA